MHTQLLCAGQRSSWASLLCFAGLSLLAMPHAAAARDEGGFAIQSPDVVTGGLVLGDSVTINVTAPSSGLLKHVKVLMNGQDVTPALRNDGGSITGVVAGLSAGPNLFELFLHDGREVFVTFSAGVTAWQAGEALETTLERADEALYEAKRTGKNRTCIG